LAIVDVDVGVDEVAMPIVAANPQLRYPTDSSGNRILVAISARPRVVNRTEPAINALLLLKRGLIQSEGVIRWLGDPVAHAL
jgi:hypothetical protein